MNVQQKSYSRAKADGILDLLGDAGFLEAYAATAKLLGTCFAYSPKEEASMRALAAIRSMDVASDWPFDAEAEEGTTGETSMRAQAASLIEDGLSEDEASLAQEYQRLFVGPGHLAAAPWGSVYRIATKCSMAARGSSFMPGCASMVWSSNTTSTFLKIK